MKTVDLSNRRSWLLLLGLQLILTVPFLGQAFHMDDHIYMDIGRNILQKPFEPHDFPYCFEGYCAADMAGHSHPPLNGYWIAMAMRLLGDDHPSKEALHLFFLPFPLLFTTSIFILARRFTARPFLASALAIASPTAVVLSHTLMADFPTMALWTAGVAFFIQGSDRNSPYWLGLSAVWLILAAFCSYPALLAALLCWWYAALHSNRSRLAWWIPLFPILFMSLWILKSSLYFGRLVLSGTVQYVLHQNESYWTALGEKGVAFPLLIAGTILMPWVLTAGIFPIWSGRIAALLAMAGAVLVQSWAAAYPLTDKILFIILFWLGTMTLAALAWWSKGALTKILSFNPNPDPSRKTAFRPIISRLQERLGHADFPIQDRLFLLGWFWSVAAVAILLYTSSSARYFMPLVPPLSLLTIGFLDCTTHRLSLWLGRFSVLVSICWALALSLADRQTAALYHRMGEVAGHALAGWEAKVRFGGEWGFRQAMESRGFRSFTSTATDLRGGDFILLPSQAVPYTLPQDMQSIAEPLRSVRFLTRYPLQLMSREAHAGFYSSSWGFLPFNFSRLPSEELIVLQINPLAESLPESNVTCTSGEKALPEPAPQGGVDLLFYGNCEINFPLGAAPPSQIRFHLIGDSRIASQNPDLSAVIQRPSGPLPVKTQRLSGDRIQLDLPITSSTDHLVLSVRTGSSETGYVSRLRNLTRIPTGNFFSRDVYVP